MYYKEDSTADGWFPRPIIAANKEAWKKLFQPDNIAHGIPIDVTSIPLMERGERQSWRYNVQFQSGDKKEFIYPCIPLPVTLTRQDVLDRLPLVPHQIPRKT